MSDELLSLAEKIIAQDKEQKTKRRLDVREKTSSLISGSDDVLAEIDQILAVEDLLSAQLKYQELGSEIQNKSTPRNRRRIAREARKALGSVFGHNVLRGQEFSRKAKNASEMRALQSKTLTQDERDREKFFRQRNVLTPFSGTSKIVYRPRGRDIVLTQYEPESGEHGLTAALAADRRVAQSILDRKEKLEKLIKGARKEQKKIEYKAELKKLTKYATQFVASRKDVWEEALRFESRYFPKPGQKTAPGRAPAPIQPAQTGDTFVSPEGTKLLIRRRMGDGELAYEIQSGVDDGRLKNAKGRRTTDDELRELGFKKIS